MKKNQKSGKIILLIVLVIALIITAGITVYIGQNNKKIGDYKELLKAYYEKEGALWNDEVTVETLSETSCSATLKVSCPNTDECISIPNTLAYVENDRLTFKIQDGNKEEIELKTKLIGKHNVMNITAAIAIGNYLGIPIKNMKASIREIQSVEHRLQLIPHGNLTIIDDSYNANPVSSKLALDTLAEFEGIKIIVTPGLIELGEEERKYNFEFGQYITEVCDYIFLVGEDHSKEVLEGIHSRKFNKRKIFVVHTPEEAVKKANRYAVKNKVTVLLENDLPDNYNV